MENEKPGRVYLNSTAKTASKIITPCLVAGLYLLGGSTGLLWGMLIAFFIWTAAENEYRAILAWTIDRLKGLRVSNLMKIKAPIQKFKEGYFCSPKDDLVETIVKMHELDLSSLPVVDQNFVIGRISRKEITEYLNNFSAD